MLKTESYLKSFKPNEASDEEKSDIVTVTAIAQPSVPEIKRKFEELTVEKAGHVTEDGQFYADGEPAPDPLPEKEQEGLVEKTAKEGGKLLAGTAVGKALETVLGSIFG